MVCSLKSQTRQHDGVMDSAPWCVLEKCQGSVVYLPETARTVLQREAGAPNLGAAKAKKAWQPCTYAVQRRPACGREVRW
jgi:hypothetical protein